MTDKEVNYRAMARQAVQKLTDHRSVWEKAAPRLVPGYGQVVKLLGDFDAIGTQVAGTGRQGYTDAKDRAVAAAMCVVKGLRNVQLNHYRPELAKVVGYEKSELDGLRDENLVKALEAIAAAATLVATELAQERVKAAVLQDLKKKTDDYRPLVGTPRGQIIAGSTLRTTGRKLMRQLRTAFGPIDTRMDGLGEEDEFKAMVAEYRRARRLVAGGRARAARRGRDGRKIVRGSTLFRRHGELAERGVGMSHLRARIAEVVNRKMTSTCHTAVWCQRLPLHPN